MCLRIIKLSTYLVFVSLLLVGSACKKESNNGVPGGPKEETFSGCRLSQVGLYNITYNADGSLKTLGDWVYQYNENEVVLKFRQNGAEKWVYLLDARKFPIMGKIFHNSDSTYEYYTYNEEGYLIKVNSSHYQSGYPKIDTERIYGYANGNRTKVGVYWNDKLVEKVSFKYDYTKLDKRKDFYERVYLNFGDAFDFYNGFPVYKHYNDCKGKWNANLVTEIDIEFNGIKSVYDLKNYFDAKGNLVKTIYEQNRSQVGTNTFKYECQ